MFDDNFPFLATHAKREYEAAQNPIPERGRRVLNDVLSVIKKNATAGYISVYAHRYHANSISYTAKPINFRERWAAYWNESDYGPSGVRIELNDADITFVVDTLGDCGYNVSEVKEVGFTISFSVSWNS